MSLNLKFDQYFDINPEDQLFFWGSCFSENISSKLSTYGLDVMANSHGIIFNPVSISKAIEDCVHRKEIIDSELIKNDDVYSHLNFHGDFNALSADEVLENCNSSILSFNQCLNSTKKSKVFITLGSAWVYESNGEIVANCHKLPSDLFNKRMLTIEECKNSFENIKHHLDKVLTDYEIHFTVSPVRHKKDGWIENNLSKSTLLLAVNEFINKEDNCFYFPVYEWVIDILRDYAYFDLDGVHPNEKAVDFVFDQFTKHYFNSDNREYLKKRRQINLQINHRVQLPGSNAHKKFLITLISQIENLEKEYRFLQLDTEKQRIRRDLEKYFNHGA